MIQPLSLYSSQTGSFKKRKVSQGWVQFYQSYDIKVNNKKFGLLSPSQMLPAGDVRFSLTGTARFGFGQGTKQDFNITITQDAPYDFKIQSIAWAITEALIA